MDSPSSQNSSPRAFPSSPRATSRPIGFLRLQNPNKESTIRSPRDSYLFKGKEVIPNHVSYLKAVLLAGSWTGMIWPPRTWRGIWSRGAWSMTCLCRVCISLPCKHTQVRAETSVTVTGITEYCRYLWELRIHYFDMVSCWGIGLKENVIFYSLEVRSYLNWKST